MDFAYYSIALIVTYAISKIHHGKYLFSLEIQRALDPSLDFSNNWHGSCNISRTRLSHIVGRVNWNCLRRPSEEELVDTQQKMTS